MKTIKCIITPRSFTISDAKASVDPPLSVSEFSREISSLRDGFDGVDEQQIREIGRKLFQRVFSEEMLARYRSSDPIPLALVARDDLALLPWELLHDGENWIARTRGVVRVMTTQQRSPEILPKPGALKILVAISNPLLPDNEHSPEQPEPVDANASFQKLEGDKFPAVVKIQRHVTRDILTREASENYHVLHFVGHGKTGRLMLESRYATADLVEESWLREKIAVGLRGGLRLMVINTCFSPGSCDEVPGIVSNIMETGLPVVIAMQGRISEPANASFVKSLYNALGRGKPIDEAITEARCAMAADWQTGAWEWATPALFINESLLEAETPLSLIDAEMVEMMGAPRVNIVEPHQATPDPMMTREERFVGRKRELSSVLRFLDPERQDAARVVCLYGDAGMGKTAIAIEAAKRMAEWFDGIIWFSPSAPRVRGASKAYGTFPEFHLRDGRRRLLVLDGIENFARREFENLLISLPANCKALITSYEPLGIGEVHIQIGPMKSPDSTILLAAYSGLNTSRLSSSEIGEIVHFTGGHPMSMRLLMSQLAVSGQALDDLLKDISRAKGRIFDFILKRSLDLAGPDGKKIFLATAIFYPTAGRKALQSVCELDDEEFGRAIKTVAELSLLESYEQGKRFGLHQLARTQAQQKLESGGESEKYYERMAGFLMEFIKATVPMTQPEIAAKALAQQMPTGLLRQQMIQDAAMHILVKPAVDMLEMELINCFLALEWMLSKGKLDMAGEFFSGLSWFLISRGHWNEAIYYLNRIIEGLQSSGKQHIELIILMGLLHERQNKWEEAITYYENALNIARESHNKNLEANILNGLGNVYFSQENLDEASEYLEASREIFHDLGDEVGEASALNNLGSLYQRMSRWEDAIRCFENSREIFEHRDEKPGKADSLSKLAGCYMNLGKYLDAGENYNLSLELFAHLGNKEAQSNVLNSLGELHHKQGDLDQAMQYYQDSLKIKRELGDRPDQQKVLENIALVNSMQKQWMKSAINCIESFQTASQIHPSIVIDSLRTILGVSKRMFSDRQFAIPAQLAQQLSQIIQKASVELWNQAFPKLDADEGMRTALAMSHGVFTMIGFMAACEFKRESEIYKEAMELARSIDEKTGAALKLVNWLEGDEQ